jgi:hypothetical protein
MNLTPETTVEELRAALAAVRLELARNVFESARDSGFRSVAIDDSVALALVNQMVQAEMTGEEIDTAL